MGRVILHIALMTFGALVLAGCGFVDSHAYLPEFMRIKDGGPPPLEPAPDVKQLVRGHLDAVFTATSAPRDVQVSVVHPNLRGPGWTACVRAEVNSATGKPLGMQTYRIDIEEGVILDRQRAEDSDSCASESFEPI
jgi:hypothetical protein